MRPAKSPRAGKPLPYIKTVRARGKVYEYFVTGRLEAGKPVLRRLPARGDPTFGRSYAGMVAARHARENASAAVTMVDLIRAYQASPKFKKRAANTQNTYALYCRIIDDAMGAAPVADVERRDVQALIDKMQDRPGAANMTLAVLRNLFRHAVKHEWASADPSKDVEQVEPSGDTYEPWPGELLAAALADPNIGLAVGLLYFTAQRIGDVCRMKWSDVQEGRVSVVQDKTDKPLDIPLHRDLAVLLAAADRDASTILHLNGRRLREPTLRGRLQRWAKAQGLHVVPHGLRKNAVNALLEAGCSVAQTAAISGQSLAMVEHYARRRDNRKLASAAIDQWERQ